jgi:hypothetical protein
LQQPALYTYFSKAACTQCNLGVAIGGFQACMTEPCALRPMKACLVSKLVLFEARVEPQVVNPLAEPSLNLLNLLPLQ